MLHQDLAHLVKVPTHPTTSMEAHHQATGVAAVLLLALDPAPTSETCLTLLHLAGSLPAKVSQVVPVAPTLPAVLDLGATTLFLQALVALVVPVLTRPPRFLPTKERLPAPVPLKTRSQLLLDLVLIGPRLLLPADRWRLLQSPSHWPKAYDNLRMPRHLLSTRSLQLKKFSRLLLF
jgi:hypothetical protein